jgi:hypothetical protein
VTLRNRLEKTTFSLRHILRLCATQDNQWEQPFKPTTMATPQSVLSRPISVYSFPPSLLAHLAVRSIQDAQQEETTDAAQPAAVTPSNPAPGSLRCQTCPGAGFETVEEQRNHFKSDWHRYNAKAKLTGRAVSAEEWEGMVEGELSR